MAFIWIIIINVAREHAQCRWLIVGLGVVTMFAGRVLAYLVASTLEQFQIQDSPIVVYVLVILLIVAVLLVLPDGAERLRHRKQHISIESSSDKFVQKCKFVSEKYKLTKRESEIFSLLVQGRSQGVIAQKLTITEGTAHVHVTHIYQKVGIHRQQELITAFEKMNIEADHELVF